MRAKHGKTGQRDQEKYSRMFKNRHSDIRPAARRLICARLNMKIKLKDHERVIKTYQQWQILTLVCITLILFLHSQHQMNIIIMYCSISLRLVVLPGWTDELGKTNIQISHPKICRMVLSFSGPVKDQAW